MALAVGCTAFEKNSGGNANTTNPTVAHQPYTDEFTEPEPIEPYTIDPFTSAATEIWGEDNSIPVVPTAPVAAGQAQSKPSAAILKGKANPNAGTPTGLTPLPLREIGIADPNNAKGLPTKKIEHAYGVAVNELPHQISIGNQNFFDTKGYAAAAYDNKTPGKVLYLTFDCGYENGNTAKVLDVLKEKQVKAAFFCTVDEFKAAPDLIARMIQEGHIVGNHSTTHPSFAGISRAEMAKEIITADNYLRQTFGYSAPFFRFPKGEYTESALDAVASLGYTSVFWSAAYSDWDTSAQKGAQYAIDTVTARMHPGAVLLLHSVSKDNADGLAAIIDKARAMGYTFKDLTQLPLFD
jgi:peptidoglycan-N-acetylmuramic acid deacetylase